MYVGCTKLVVPISSLHIHPTLEGVLKNNAGGAASPLVFPVQDQIVDMIRYDVSVSVLVIMSFTSHLLSDMKSICCFDERPVHRC